MKEENKSLTIPKTVIELVQDEDKWIERDALNGILNQAPPKAWLKEYSGFTYLPIDKVEYTLKRLFQQYRIEVLREGQLFNSIYCTVRVHYLDPISKEWTFQDGVGAVDVQKEKGASPAALEKVNFGAIMKGLPSAKSYAIKDACELIGNIFGSNLNRKDTIGFELAKQTVEHFTPEEKKKEIEEIKDGLELCFDENTLNLYFKQLTNNKAMTPEIRTLFSERKKQL